ncbi:hypothetical protein F9L33_09615 [Amylibacter sp. SFDW26]|uniref:hypothetical protein n=1 Tax=Amylibacter sp. SFDW26 TaxID=2652722 RepID=UPI001261C9B3|nr:hypothetical protein [Amylibacter sp. SFDW26]KAB7613626.1 hypothetical protein F9L33_09615 [Amylibacter sp. SFDW26]
MSQFVNGIPFSAELDTRFSPVYKAQLSQLTCVVPGGGCVYFRANQGDVCPFCAFPIFARHVVRGPGFENDFSAWTLDTQTYTEMFQQSLDLFPVADKITVFNGGSFFPEAELPKAFQDLVYKTVSGLPGTKQLMVEAYPKFISKTALRRAKEHLGEKDFMVGIGFESENDFVRNKLLKKRIDRNEFEAKVRLMQSMGVQVFVYAFLGAPGLDDRQSLEEAKSTCRYLHNLGVDEIALSCAFVPPGSPIEELYNHEKFRPPWLWSILEVQKLAEKEGWPLSIGGFEDFPPPVSGPSNCDLCDEDFKDLLDRVRLTGELPQHMPVCNCQDRWHRTTS